VHLSGQSEVSNFDVRHCTNFNPSARLVSAANAGRYIDIRYLTELFSLADIIKPVNSTGNDI
jgi:hypothetical protein